MKIAFWATTAAVGLTLLGACHHDGDTTASNSGGTGGAGNSGPTSSAPGSSAPSSSAPSDFVAFVNQQIGSEPDFGSAPAVTTSLTTNLALGAATTFTATPFGTGDAVPAGTFQAATACTQAGTTACNPAVSADLNSTLN